MGWKAAFTMSQNLAGLTVLVSSNGLLKFSWKLWQKYLRNMCFWEQDNIYFAMLLSVAMHLLQLLDVCVFSLVKELWRKIQQEWEREVKTGTFQQFFLSLLKWLVNSQSGSIKHNLESGFQTTGIFLLNHQEPLSRLASPILHVSESNVSMNKRLIGLLRENQGSGEGQKWSREKNKTWWVVILRKIFRTKQWNR